MPTRGVWSPHHLEQAYQVYNKMWRAYGGRDSHIDWEVMFDESVKPGYDFAGRDPSGQSFRNLLSRHRLLWKARARKEAAEESLSSSQGSSSSDAETDIEPQDEEEEEGGGGPPPQFTDWGVGGLDAEWSLAMPDAEDVQASSPAADAAAAAPAPAAPAPAAAASPPDEDAIQRIVRSIVDARSPEVETLEDKLEKSRGVTKRYKKKTRTLRALVHDIHQQSIANVHAIEDLISRTPAMREN